MDFEAEPAEGDWEPDSQLAAELDRRLDAHDANPDLLRTSEQVWDRIRGLAPPLRFGEGAGG